VVSPEQVLELMEFGESMNIFPSAEVHITVDSLPTQLKS
jgi:hypothetical protein